MNNPRKRYTLVTGATGFLGNYVVTELLHHTEDLIVCIINAENEEEARLKLVHSLTAQGLWTADFNDRLILVLGDLSVRHFGLSTDDYLKLSTMLDRIIHLASNMDRRVPYEALKAINVTGTREMVSLAINMRFKPIYFMSDLALFYQYESDFLPENSLPEHYTHLDAYGQSKAISELLLMKAREFDLQYAVIRSGQLGPDFQNGYGKEHSFFNRFVRSIVNLGLAPRLDARLELVPVDVAARTVCAIANAEGLEHINFHLTQHYPLQIKDLIDYLKAAGYAIEVTGTKQWVKAYFKAVLNGQVTPLISKEETPDLIHSHLLSHLRFRNKSPRFYMTNTISVLGSEDPVPKPDRDYIHRIINHMQKSGFLPLV